MALVLKFLGSVDSVTLALARQGRARGNDRSTYAQVAFN
jgi:hypothetical protein